MAVLLANSKKVERKKQGLQGKVIQYCSLKVDLGLRTYIAGAELTFSWTYFVERLHDFTTYIEKYNEIKLSNMCCP